MEILRFSIHFGLHFLFPGIIAYVLFRKQWKKAWLIMVLTMLIDLDHLITTPIFDPNRCSINFHPLHTYYAGFSFMILLIFKKTRVIGIGFIFHLITDYVDCFFI